MFSLQLRVHDVESFVPPLEPLSDERAKHPVFLVHAVEESADVTALAKNTVGTPHRTAVRFHFSPPAKRANHLLQRTCSGSQRRRQSARAPERSDLPAIILLVRIGDSPGFRVGTGQEE